VRNGKEEEKEVFYKNLLTCMLCILGMAEDIFFKLGLWPPVHGGIYTATVKLEPFG